MATITLKQKILNEIENEKRGYAEQVAKIAGFSNGSNLKKKLRNENGEFDDFYGLINMVRFLFPNEEKQLMKEYAMSLDPNKKTARFMLLYLGANTDYETREELIKKLKSSNNTFSKEWGTVFEIDLKCMNKEIDYLNALEQFSMIEPKCSILKIINTIFKSYCYLDQKTYDLAYKIISRVEKDINEIEDEYIKNTLKAKYLLIEIECLIRNNKIGKAREKCIEIINLTNEWKYVSWAYLHLGNSYILEDYNKANEYLQKGLTITQNENAKIEFQRSLNFLCNLWGHAPLYLNFNSQHPSDKHEVTFYYINQGKHELAKNLLDNENLNELNSNELGFHYYLRGLVTNKLDDFTLSVKYFNKSGDQYFIRLPLIKMRDLGVSESIINIFID